MNGPFNGKPQATAFLSQASIQNAGSCGLPLNKNFGSSGFTVVVLSMLGFRYRRVVRRLHRFTQMLLIQFELFSIIPSA